MTTVALVEDDEIIRANFSDFFEDEGFNVRAFSTVNDAKHAFQTWLPDIALLDISLGDASEGGFELCKYLRQRSASLPILFFTSHDCEFDKISGMRLDADDYITKDSSMQYLLVRIHALLRRIKARRNIAPENDGMSSNLSVIGALSIDPVKYVVYWKSTLVPISLTQFWIVKCLVDKPGQLKNHDQLMKAANLVVEPNTITAHIKNIREKFLSIDPGFKNIKTERGAGYRWLPEA